MPNSIAYLVLLLWPVACWLLFRKTSTERAIIWSLLGGYLILPPVANLNLPLLPSVDKTTMPSLAVLVIGMVFLGKGFLSLPSNRLAKILILVFVAGAIPTVLANRDPTVFSVLPNSDPIVYRSWQLPGLNIRDVISALGNQVIVLIPFLLARQFLADKRAVRELLVAFVLAALVYSVPALFEIRFSPQLNIWIYGFFQHEFIQTMRAGGFRPIVFLPHSLWLAFFVVTALLAATALARRTEREFDQRFVMAALYLGLLLLLCKSFASIAYGLCLAPLVFFINTRAQVFMAVGFALVATLYPLLRGSGYVPVEALLDWAHSISPDRAASLAYRFDNEELLLERANERPWLGWGGWGRNLIMDIETQEIITIPDGRWIIVFGTYGWLGYVAEFGLLSLPLLLLGREAFRSGANAIPRTVSAIALILSINMIDMLLNAALTPITWMLAGAVLGHVEQLRAVRKADERAGADRPSVVIGRTPEAAMRRTEI